MVVVCVYVCVCVMLSRELFEEGVIKLDFASPTTLLSHGWTVITSGVCVCMCVSECAWNHLSRDDECY